MMYIVLCTFFQGTDATVETALLPWENCMGRGQSQPVMDRHRERADLVKRKKES